MIIVKFGKKEKVFSIHKFTKQQELAKIAFMSNVSGI